MNRVDELTLSYVNAGADWTLGVKAESAAGVDLAAVVNELLKELGAPELPGLPPIRAREVVASHGPEGFRARATIALPDDFKIVVMDPRSSTPGLGLVVWIKEAYGDRAAEIWGGLKPHILTMSRGWSEGYGLFTSGESDMVLSYTTSPPYHAIAENDERFAAAQFSEGHVEQVEVSGILKSSPNQQLARDFLAYLLSPEGQKVIPTTNWMYPVADIGADLPAAFPAQPVKVLPVDEAEVTAERNSWIEEALAAIR